MPGRSGTVRDSGLPAASREVFRLTTPVVVWWAWVAFAAANLIDLAVQGSKAHSAFVIGAVLLLITGFAGLLEATVMKNPGLQFGFGFVEFLQSLRTNWGDAAMVGVAMLGDWLVTLSLGIVGCVALLVHRRFRLAMGFILALAGGMIFVAIIVDGIPLDARATYIVNFGESYPHFHCLVMARGDDVPPEFRGGNIVGLRKDRLDRSAALALVPAVRTAYEKEVSS